MAITIRLAHRNDIPDLEALIPLSARKLQATYYSSDQIEGALGTVFGVDSQLISDGTYFVAEAKDQIVGCGGWSKRKTLFGGDGGKAKGDDSLLDPSCESARIRAFFVHPDWSRQGIGSRIMKSCEDAARQAGFTVIELVATLAGEPLYASFSYRATERYTVPLPNGMNMPVVRMFKSFDI